MEESGIKVKEKRPGQRVCDEKDGKGKLCLGHLKRWYTAPSEIIAQVGNDGEIYRCDKCQALYRPSNLDRSSVGQRYVERTVNLLGDPVRARSK